jgi:hypothetical protein
MWVLTYGTILLGCGHIEKIASEVVPKLLHITDTDTDTDTDTAKVNHHKENKDSHIDTPFVFILYIFFILLQKVYIKQILGTFYPRTSSPNYLLAEPKTTLNIKQSSRAIPVVFI